MMASGESGTVKNQVYNPYLPLTTYIPDGEPHVFGDRVYIYGSHDAIGGKVYCPGHYEVWSAPVSDLTDWKCEGTSYLRSQDPTNADDSKQLWAPDVTQGPDGRFYLYYCFNFYPEIGVAVSDSPAGPFKYYGHVHYPDHILGGKLLQEGMVFDPAVLTDEDGRVYLYYGFAPAGEKEMKAPDFSDREILEMPEEDRKMIMHLKGVKFGENSMVVELMPDMVTAKEEPRILIPGGHHTAGTGFEGHGFFEASSIRKLNGKYYFVYSSHKSHELCYAVSDRPDSGFVYGGTIVSNGDIGLDGRLDPVYPLSNNHGGLVKIGEDYYIFYHRATDGTEYSRQGCAEKVEIKADGSIAQVEMTSCGLNGGPLKASGFYPASIACHVKDPSVVNAIDYRNPDLVFQTAVTESRNESYIGNIRDQSVIGYKYFDFSGPADLALEFRGSFKGTLTVSHDAEGNEACGGLDLAFAEETWTATTFNCSFSEGKHALYLSFRGEGKLEFRTFGFIG